ncbi:MAG: PD-(D/E)XK nuclease family protein, partial [Lachnospiraceae bacterium]|nr:PD-(D/E)XK nuclease family protein [Candidatus Equihabitans merdae]
QEQRRLEEGRLSAATITEVGCYYDLVLPVVLSHENDETKQFDLREYDKDAFILKAEEELENTRLGIDYLESMDLDQISDQEMHDIIQERFNYHYPEEGSSTTPMKVSVSYVKQEHMQDEDGVRTDQPEKPRSVIPEFKKDEEERQYLWGAELGTAYHDVLYRLDFPSCCDDSGQANYENILHQMDDMLDKGIINEKVHRSVRIKKLMHFLNSDLGRRAVEGARQGSLKKEQPFSMNVPAADLDPDWDPNQKVLIQGIIDAYFEEDDGIILYDYKTDRSEETSFYPEHYWIQLDLYRRALEGATGKPVREMWIYAFTPEEAIKLEMKK